MANISGVAKRYDGLPVDYVSIFNWSNGQCIAQIIPDALGNWSYRYSSTLNCGITYVSDGCEPLTHGAYNFVVTTPEDYILHYDFNGNVLDRSDSSLDGIRTGVTNFVAGRKEGTQALEFVAGCVRTPTDLPISSDKLTISFWISTSQNNFGVICESSSSINTNNDSFACFLNDTKPSELQSVTRGVTGIDGYNAVSTPVDFNGNWQHILVTIDRAKVGNQEQNIYVNNTLSSSYVTGNTADVNRIFRDHVFHIGQRNASSAPFVGKIQDMRVYNRLLNADERLALFNE